MATIKLRFLNYNEDKCSIIEVIYGEDIIYLMYVLNMTFQTEKFIKIICTFITDKRFILNTKIDCFIFNVIYAS